MDCMQLLLIALQTQVCSEYIGSLAQTPDGQTVIAARGDGNLSLLDLRKAGEQVAVMSHSSPLLCCQTDGQVAVTGSQDGQVRTASDRILKVCTIYIFSKSCPRYVVYHVMKGEKPIMLKQSLKSEMLLPCHGVHECCPYAKYVV